MRRPDHVEQRLRHRRAIEDKFGIEYLVTAMFRVRLREHHELGIGRIASECAKGREQIIELHLGEGESPVAVGARKACAPLRANGHAAQRARAAFLKQRLRIDAMQPHGFGHSIVQCGTEAQQCRLIKQGLCKNRIAATALQPADKIEAADARDIGRLAGPRRYRANARCHDQHLACRWRRERRWRVAQQAPQQQGLPRVRRVDRVHQVHPVRTNGHDARIDKAELRYQSIQPELGQCGSATETEHQLPGPVIFARWSPLPGCRSAPEIAPHSILPAPRSCWCPAS